MAFLLFRDWRFWLAIALLTAIVSWLIWQADVTCSSTRKRHQMEIIKANSCFEFWLNRYQSAWSSLLATAGVVVTGWLAWTGVRASVGHQAQANLLSELTFWQRRYDDAYAASASAEQGLEICKAIRNEIAKPHVGVYPHVSEALRLTDLGFFPIAVLNPRGIERVAVKFNRLADIANRYQHLRNQPGEALRAADEALGSQLQEIAALDNPFETLVAEVREEASKSGVIVAKLYATNATKYG